MEMKTIPVLARNIGIYEEIRYEDLKSGKVPKEQDTSKYINDTANAIGKVSKIELKEGNLILKSDLVEKGVIANKEYVTIKVDYARTGGAKPGDRVDVYKVNKETDEWTMPYEAELISQNVLVIEITDKSGNKGGGSTGAIPLSNDATKVEVIKLCVNSGQAARLVIGSVNENSGLALVVKK